MQHVVALFTIEVENLILCDVVKESNWLKGLLYGFEVSHKVVKIICDDESTMQFKKHPTLHEKNKHINIRMQFVRGMVNEGFVKDIKFSTT